MCGLDPRISLSSAWMPERDVDLHYYFFFSSEGLPREPRHIHVKGSDKLVAGIHVFSMRQQAKRGWPGQTRP